VIKKRIEALIDREYLKRSDDDQQRYNVNVFISFSFLIFLSFLDYSRGLSNNAKNVAFIQQIETVGRFDNQKKSPQMHQKAMPQLKSTDKVGRQSQSDAVDVDSVDGLQKARCRKPKPYSPSLPESKRRKRK
jgi:hypothetical protein